LQTPSAQTAGIKVNISENIALEGQLKLWLDFDAGRSVVKKGNNDFLLKPVIRTFKNNNSGSIRGSVLPVDAHPYIYLKADNNQVFSTYSDTVTGGFLIRGIVKGNYTVYFSSAKYGDRAIKEKYVNNNEVTDLGLIEF
jgi:hypothetical protein